VAKKEDVLVLVASRRRTCCRYGCCRVLGTAVSCQPCGTPRPYSELPTADGTKGFRYADWESGTGFGRRRCRCCCCWSSIGTSGLSNLSQNLSAAALSEGTTVKGRAVGKVVVCGAGL
jgi:hypothetical protein